MLVDSENSKFSFDDGQKESYAGAEGAQSKMNLDEVENVGEKEGEIREGAEGGASELGVLIAAPKKKKRRKGRKGGGGGVKS